MYAREVPVTCGYIRGEFVSVFRREVLYGLQLTPSPSPSSTIVLRCEGPRIERLLPVEVQVRSAEVRRALAL